MYIYVYILKAMKNIYQNIYHDYPYNDLNIQIIKI